MPSIDVSEIVNDVDFTDFFSVARNVESVDSNGNAQIAIQTWNNVSGVVLPQDSSVLIRTPDGSMQAGDIVIYTQFPLSDGYNNIQADTVTWHNMTYTVFNINDFSSFGYIEAICKIARITA